MAARTNFARPSVGTVSVTVSIPTPLRGCSGGRSELSLHAANLQTVLDELERSHPALHRSICDETGKVRQHINLWVNTDHMRDCGGVEARLAAGDIITIMTAVSGG